VLGLLFPGKGFHVVNNNAAAVLLALNTLAEGREVVVSRGERVEIGGSFRIPDVLRKAGVRSQRRARGGKGGPPRAEARPPHKPRLQDYERAISEKTGLILKVHP